MMYTTKGKLIMIIPHDKISSQTYSLNFVTFYYNVITLLAFRFNITSWSSKIHSIRKKSFAENIQITYYILGILNVVLYLKK